MKFRFFFWDVLPCKIIVDQIILHGSTSQKTNLKIKTLPTKFTSNSKAWMTSNILENALHALDVKMG
jgi:hypothetical protein